MTSGPEGQSRWGAYPHDQLRLPHNILKLQVKTLYLHNIDLSNGVQLGTHYKHVECENCTISAHVLSNLCECSHLRALLLRGCVTLPTRLPPTTGGLTNLERIEISGLNNLCGKLKNLTGLYLNHTKLSGSIPSELGKLKKLTYLNLSHNDLTGRIPQSLGDIPKLQELEHIPNHIYLRQPTPA